MKTKKRVQRGKQNLYKPFRAYKVTPEWLRNIQENPLPLSLLQLQLAYKQLHRRGGKKKKTYLTPLCLDVKMS